MKLIDHAGRVLRHAWSIKLALLSAALSACEVAIPLLAPEARSVPFAALAGLVALAAAVVRLVAQPKLHRE